MPITTNGFTWLDWTVLLGYFASIILFGLWMSRKTASSGGYFLGERKLPWWVMIGQAFGSGTHAENPVAQAGASYQLGFATIWYQWKNMLVTPFYWLMAPWYRRTGRTTIAELVGDRYGRGLAFLYTVFAISYFIFCQGAMLKGAGKVVSSATGDDFVSPNTVVVLMPLAFLTYGLLGGLVAAAYTEFVQGFFIIMMSFMLIPAGLNVIGGFSGLHETLQPNFFDLYSQVSKIDAYTIALLSLNGFVGICAQPHILSVNSTGKTERAGRVGQTYGNMVKRFCTIGWAFTGLIVAAMLLQTNKTLEDPEQAFGYAGRHLLGSGLTGLLVACILAANMATCSNFLVNAGALVTQNLYKVYFRPDASDRELLRMGRLAGLGTTILAVLFALSVEKVLDAFLFTETLSTFFGIMILGGFLWRRANRWGAWAAILVSISVYFGINYHDTGVFQLVYKWLPTPFGWSMLAGFGVFFLVSLMTPAESQERTEAFFDKLRRSSDSDALLPDGTRPLARERGQDLLLVDLTGWFTAERWHGFFRRYRQDLLGFLGAWATVGLLIAMAWGLMRIGE